MILEYYKSKETIQIEIYKQKLRVFKINSINSKKLIHNCMIIIKLKIYKF